MGLILSVLVNGGNTVSQPYQNHDQYIYNSRNTGREGCYNIPLDPGITIFSNHSDLGSESLVITSRRNIACNEIITSAQIEGVECLSNLSTYKDWSQLENQVG